MAEADKRVIASSMGVAVDDRRNVVIVTASAGISRTEEIPDTPSRELSVAAAVMTATVHVLSDLLGAEAHPAGEGGWSVEVETTDDDDCETCPERNTCPLKADPNLN